MNKRGTEEGIGKLVKYIIAIVVLVLVLIGLVVILNPKLMDYFKNLPGYNYTAEDKEIEPTPDANIVLNYEKTAKITDSKNILVCADMDCKEILTTNLYFGWSISGSGNSRGGTLYLSVPPILSFNPKNLVGWDKSVGEIINNKIIIYPQYLNSQGYAEIKDYVKLSDLQNLNNGVYYSGMVYKEKK